MSPHQWNCVLNTLDQEAQDLLDKPFQVVAGKGGVGRTLISSALALRSSRMSRKTLLLEINAPDHCARALGVNSVIDKPKTVLPNLDLCRMTPEGALREYALMILKFPALYRLVFENPFIKYFLKSIPSLGEFTMLGKAWFHAQETLADGSPRYECVIIDAPATGHALTFLSVARTVALTVPAGPMKSAAIKMAELVENEKTSCAHLVVTPEDMPVNEGLELRQKLQERVKMKHGLSFMNRVTFSKVSEADENFFSALESKVEQCPDLRPYVDIAVARRGHLEHQSIHCDRFKTAVPSSILVEDLRTLKDDQARVLHLADLWSKETDGSGGKAL